MPDFPRYTTYRPGELEAKIRQIAPDADAATLAQAMLPGIPGVTKVPGEPSAPSKRGRLLKEHACPVPYPDGKEGQCSYERKGPAFHRFEFRFEGAALSERLWWTWPLENTREAIEAKAREMAPEAYGAVITRERKEYFMRASESAARLARPELFRMSAARAKEFSGKYALCRQVSRTLLAVSPSLRRWRMPTPPGGSRAMSILPSPAATGWIDAGSCPGSTRSTPSSTPGQSH